MRADSLTTPSSAVAAQFESLTALYGPIIETTTDAIVITDARRRIAFANRAAASLFGIAVDRLLGLAVASLTPPETHEDIARHESLAFGGEPQWYETAIVRADGERRTVSVSSAPLNTGDGILGVVASLRDVTEERRARDAVVQSEARYRKLFESATDAIYTLDVRGHLTSANPATCEITGYPVEALLGRSMTTLIDPDELQTLRENFRAARAGIPCRYEAYFYRADGERRLASVTNTPIHRAGEVVGVLGIARDITEDRRRDAELRQVHTRYQRLVESAWDAIFTVDADGRFTSLNEALEVGLGISRERLLQMRFEEVVEPADRLAMRAAHAAAMRGERQRGEVRFRDASSKGEVRVGSLTLTPLIDEGRTASVLGIVRDVTDERRLGEQLMQREKLAAVGQLVSGVAHELNNPLAGVLAFSQLLMATAHPDVAVRDAVASINKEAKRAAKIISNLLLFARQRPPERTATDLNQVVHDAVELRRYALRTHQIDMRLELDPALPPVCADGPQLQQVMLNLITNAEHVLADHGGEKRLTISTQRAGDMLRVTVADSGPGVPLDLQDRIFNPFFTTKKVGEGTGLGLSISDGIVREHGGQIRLASSPPGGAVFVIDLPATTPDDEALDAAAGPRRMLLVAPPSDERDAVATRLAADGHAAVAASTSRDALAHASAEEYHAVLIDLRTDAADGESLFAALTERHPALAARAVFVVAEPGADAQRRFFRKAGRPVVRAPQSADVIAELLTTESRRP